MKKLYKIETKKGLHRTRDLKPDIISKKDLRSFHLQ
jgi:hypothetical protein